MALGTIGLFVFAMADPQAFAARMVGLAEVPEPLWWLLGAIVGFYFGARPTTPRVADTRGDAALALDAVRAGSEVNPALADWRVGRPPRPATMSTDTNPSKS
jgi:hypothetical protein